MTTHTLNSDPVTPSDLNASWGEYGSGFAACAYWKDPTGHVHIRGELVALGAIAAGATIFTLPTGFRPAANEIFPVAFVHAGAWAFGSVYVFSSGVVYLWQAAALNDTISLSGIIFLAEG